MKYCIPSDITALSSNADGFIERLYVGDVGGQMWRFDLCSSTTGTCVPDMSNTANWTGKRIFIAGSTGTPGSQKIFYPPDVTFETNKGQGTYDMLFFGTGDREKPNDTSVINSLYALKDYDNDTNPPTPLPLTVNNLVNVTSDVLQSSSATQAQKAAVLASLLSESGWYITLNESAGESQNPGEKCDAPAVVMSGTVYFTTFTPTPVNTQSVCTIGTGESATYPLNYQTGNAVFDLNQDGQITVADRSMQNVGAGIPSGIVITVVNGTVTAYGGVAGGVFTPQLTNTNSIVPLDWRIVF
jgi:type IV pilus assembly protein PilY1